MSASDNDNSRIKSAASSLLKGGTLVSEPCQGCGGVVVKAKEKSTCINCGRESISQSPSNNQIRDINTRPAKIADTRSAFSSLPIVENKIASLMDQLKDEEDLLIQKQKLELLEGYFRILEKMKNIPLRDDS